MRGGATSPFSPALPNRAAPIGSIKRSKRQRIDQPRNAGRSSARVCRQPKRVTNVRSTLVYVHTLSLSLAFSCVGLLCVRLFFYVVFFGEHQLSTKTKKNDCTNETAENASLKMLNSPKSSRGFFSFFSRKNRCRRWLGHRACPVPSRRALCAKDLAAGLRLGYLVLLG